MHPATRKLYVLASLICKGGKRNRTYKGKVSLGQLLGAQWTYGGAVTG